MFSRTASPEDGVTLIEVMATLALASILATLGIKGMREWSDASGHLGTASSVQTVMRNAQVRAVSEGVSYCVQVDPATDTYTVNRYGCTDGPVRVEGPFHVDGTKTQLASATFTTSDGGTMPAVTFRPNGTATPGTVIITRDGSTKRYTVTVEGFTGRVAYS